MAAETGVSRARLSRWKNRYDQYGEAGPRDRSGVPHRSPPRRPAPLTAPDPARRWTSGEERARAITVRNAHRNHHRPHPTAGNRPPAPRRRTSITNVVAGDTYERLRIRYGRRAVPPQGLLELACSIICLRRLRGSFRNDQRDAISAGAISRRSGVMTAALAERMAPEDLWTLFQRVVPPAPQRPQGGGHRRRGDRGVPAAIVFVATSGCTWNQLPPGFGLSGVTAFRRFTEWTEARVWAMLHRPVLDELGFRGGLDRSRCAIDSVSVRALEGGGRRDRVRPAAARGDRKSISSSTAGVCPCRSASPPPTSTTARPSSHWSAASRPYTPAAASGTASPQGHRVVPTPGPAPPGRGADRVLAVRLPTPPPPLRAQAGALPRHRRDAHMPPQTGQVKWRPRPRPFLVRTRRSAHFETRPGRPGRWPTAVPRRRRTGRWFRSKGRGSRRGTVRGRPGRAAAR
ncbi:hypothetical protein SUDANB176_00926 [Streptomyces sp. enrichment culture]